MANSTIPNLVAVSVPALTDLLGVRQSGDTRDKKLTVTQLLSLAPGGGDVSKVGTPVNNQIGVWTGDGTIEGTSQLKYDTVNGFQIATGPILMASGAGLIGFAAASTPELLNESATGTNPNIIPNKSDKDTGLGLPSLDQLALIAGGKQIAQCKEAVGAEQFIVSPGFVENNPALPALAFGNADTGFFESVDNTLNVSVGGVPSFQWSGTIFRALTGLGAAMQNESASSTNPTLIPSAQDQDTGIGSNAIDQVSLIAGGVEIARAIEVTNANQFAVVASGNSSIPDLTGLADLDTGFRWTGSNEIIAINGGSRSFHFLSTAFFADSSDGPILFNTFGSATVPSICVERGDANTGLGAATSDALTLISGGVTGLVLRELNSGVIQAPQANLTITAFATGGQGSAVQLDSGSNVLGTVATTGDSVKLPPLFLINSVVFIKNDGANAADVFPASGDDLGAGTDTAVSLASGASISFIATVASSTWTQWIVSVGGGGGGDVTKVGTPADNQVGVWTGDGTIEGTSALVLGASSLDISTRVRTANAAAGAPSHSFTGETNSGLYLQSSGSVGISCLGGGNWLFQTGSMFANLSGGPQIMFEASSASNPVLNPRLSDTDTGIGSGAADQLNFIAGGLSCLSVREVGSARQIGFYVTAPISLQTGVAVSSAGIHAALVSLGLITA